MHITFSSSSASARVTNFPDGTSRRTVAAITKGFHSSEALDLNYDAVHEASCSEDLLADVDSFRELVSSVSRAFVERLGESFPSKDGSPMLQSADPASEPFEDISSLVAAGDHLEHFHAYSRGDRSPSRAFARSSSLCFHRARRSRAAETFDRTRIGPSLVTSQASASHAEQSGGRHHRASSD